MRLRPFLSLLALFVSALLGACSSDRVGAVPEPKGSLNLAVRDLSASERIAILQARLVPEHGESFPVVFGAPVGGEWSQRVRDLPAGRYHAVVEAFDAEGALVRSQPAPAFEILDHRLSTVMVFLHPERGAGGISLPHFVTISLPEQPAIGRESEVRVWGRGGEGDLELTVSGDGTFGEVVGDVRGREGAVVAWTPDRPGERNLLFTLTDARGNVATAVVVVPVLALDGELELRVGFNHAPWASPRTSIDISERSIAAEVVVSFFDDSAGDIDYVFDFSACNDIGLVHDATNSDEAEGVASRGGLRRFLLEAGDGEHRSCTVGIALRDRGEAPARQTQTLTLHTRFVAPNCAEGLTECFGVCVDVEEDDANCGACGRSCTDAERCVEGQCEARCPPGQAYCDGQCVDPQSDDEHCGACGVSCGEEQVCSVGECVCDAAGLEDCGGVCVDLEVDPENCGRCGTTCGPLEFCEEGSCVCEGALEPCGDLCVDTDSDDSHCGSCGRVCDPGETCSGGTCVAEGCPPGHTLCGGVCVDTDRDAAHCGGCGQACQPYDVCQGGECYPDPEWANWPVPPPSPGQAANYVLHSPPGTVTDINTKLMWEMSPPTISRNWQSASDYCEQLTLGGFSDWRLPTRIELISIVFEGIGGPAINDLAFANTIAAGSYWTRSRRGTNTYWRINFQWGNAETEFPAASDGYVRCVRFGPGYPKASELPQPRYVVGGSGNNQYVRDTRTQLMWSSGSTGMTELLSLNNSVCNLRTYSGHRARAPMRKELETLVDVRRTTTPVFDTSVFSGYAGWYWTRSEHRYGAWYGGEWVWSVYFDTGGNAAQRSTNNNGYGRCVASPYFYP